jgi:hypothetical protein
LLDLGPNWQLTLEADPLFIGAGDDVKTGLVIEVEGGTYTAAPGAFGSISVVRTRVHLPPDLPAAPEEIVIADAMIDERGFSGEVSVTFRAPAVGEEPEPLFGALPISFQSLSLVIERNLPTEFELKVAVLMPYFDEWVDVTIGFEDDFNLSFRIETADPEGITLTKEELLSLNFRSASFDWHSDQQLLALSLSGGIEPLLWNADGLEWPRLDVTALRLEQDIGSILAGNPEPPIIRFQEAWLDLKELATLDLFGFHFELNRIGIGYVEANDELWVDLTGSLRLIEFLPMGLGVEGFRITWPRRIYEELGFAAIDQLTVDQALQLASRIQVKFDGIYLFYGVPDTVEFEGFIRFIKSAQKVGFAGDVALRVPPSGLAIDAGLMVGMNFAEPPYPFLYVYFGIQLPTGIPLGQSGLALKGARGLFGLNVEPDREPDQNPYYDWYKRGPIEGAHPTNKWRDQIWSIAFGAGITITTADGKILGIQGLLALVIPGPIIFVEGKALIFDGVFPGDSPLKALGYFDGNELTAQLNIEAALELVEGVVDVAAGIEAFFDFRNLLNWHVYLGQDEPPERRVHANFLKLPALGWLFGADAFLMIDMPAAAAGGTVENGDLTVRARLGVHIGFEPPAIDLVVASATVHAVLDGGGLLTINPFLCKGSVALDAMIDIDAFGLVAVGVQASAEMSIEGALPLIVDANIAARVDLPVPDFEEVPVVGDELASALDWFEENVVELPEIPEYLDVEIPLHWELDRPPVLDPLVTGVSVEGRFAQGGTEALRAGAGPVAGAPVVPLDARPVLLFDQNINVGDHMEFGGFDAGGRELFFAGKLAFEPSLRRVRLLKLPNHRFVDGVSEEWDEIASTDLSAAAPLWGMFRPAGEFTDGARAGRRVLELWSANPLEFLTGSIPLAIPGASEPGAGIVDPLDGIGTMPWCDTTPAREQCVDRPLIEETAASRSRKHRFVRDGEGWTQSLTIGGLEILAPDIRLVETRGSFVIFLDGPGRRSGIARVLFPARVVLARVRLLDKQVNVRALRRRWDARSAGGSVLFEVSVAVTASDDAGVRTVTVSDPDGFERLDLSSPEALRIVEICWVTARESATAAARGRNCAANAAVAPQASDPGLVLSAGAHYRVEVETSIGLVESESDLAALALGSLPGFADALEPYREESGGPLVVTDVFHFRTEGPPSDLRPYVKWLSPGEGATGCFTGDDFVIRFNRPYIHRLYPDRDNGAAGPPGSPYALDAVVVDPEGNVRTEWFLNWRTASSATLAPEEKHWFDEIAPLSAPGLSPPPDDILEIRRWRDIRSFADIAPESWREIVYAGSPSRRVKWRHLDRNTVRAELQGSAATSLYVAEGRAWRSSRVEVEATLGGMESTVGVVVLYVGVERHHQVRVAGREGGVVEIVRVDATGETLLASKKLQHRPRRDRAGTIPLSITTKPHPAGVRITCAVADAKLSAEDPFAPAAGAVGLIAAGSDATFASFSIGSDEAALSPRTRYEVSIAGGSGGKTVRHDDFSAPAIAQWWGEVHGWALTGDGLRATSANAALNYRDPFDDGELSTTIRMSAGDRVVIGLRTPDARRAPGDRHRYEIAVARGPTNCVLELSVRSDDGGLSQVIASGQTETGAEASLPIRVRMIGDNIRAWIFDRELIAARLVAVALSASHTAPVARRGSLDWRATAGTPTLREIHVRDAALLRFVIMTSAHASFTALASRLSERVLNAAVADASLAQMGAAMAAAVAAQRAAADARASFHSVSSYFAMKRAGRAALESARQALVAAQADQDDALAAVVSAFGVVPLVAPAEASVVRLELASGEVVGWLARSPESLDPRLITSSETVPLPYVGRTEFALIDGAGSALATHWVSSSDGTTVLVYRVAPGVVVSAASPTSNLQPVFGAGHAQQLRLHYERDHSDDERAMDHLLDRPYQLSGGSRDPIEVLIGLA